MGSLPRSILLVSLWLVCVARCAGQGVPEVSPAPAQAPLAIPPRVTAAIDEQQLVTLTGNVHPLARAEFDRGVVADGQALRRMLLLLQRSAEQESALQQLLADQQSKSSPRFHGWLNPQEYGREFGPADADIQAVTGWLAAHGFTEIKVGVGRTAIEFSGNAGQVRGAFHTEIHQFFVQNQARFANSGDPQVPAALKPVIAGVVSLNNFPVQSHAHKLGAFQKSPRPERRSRFSPFRVAMRIAMRWVQRTSQRFTIPSRC
jgi:subtilase family serine protease